MKKIIPLFFLLPLFCFSQSSFKLTKTIEINADFITTDNQGSLYIVKANELTKFDKSGKQLYKYSNKNFGNIDFVDVSNQLKILLFYKNFSQIIFLDNTLSMSGTPLSLDQAGFQQAQLVCTSHNNSIWIYDQQSFALVRLNTNYEETQRTGNLNNLLMIELQPNYLLEYDNKVYISNPNTGILLFDIYGTYYKTIPVKNVQHFQPIGEWVYYKNEQKIKAYHIKTGEEKEFTLPEINFDSFSLQMGILFLKNENIISVFVE